MSLFSLSVYLSFHLLTNAYLLFPLLSILDRKLILFFIYLFVDKESTNRENDSDMFFSGSDFLILSLSPLLLLKSSISTLP